MNTINRLLEMLDNFVANIEYGFAQLPGAISSPTFINTLPVLLCVISMIIIMFSTFMSIFGPGGVSMNKALLYIGSGLSIVLLFIAISIEMFLK